MYTFEIRKSKNTSKNCSSLYGLVYNLHKKKKEKFTNRTRRNAFVRWNRDTLYTAVWRARSLFTEKVSVFSPRRRASASPARRENSVGRHIKVIINVSVLKKKFFERAKKNKYRIFVFYDNHGEIVTISYDGRRTKPRDDGVYHSSTIIYDELYRTIFTALLASVIASP